MAERPFIVVIKVSLTSGADGSGIYNVDSGNTFTIREIRQKSTSTFDITGIQDQQGQDFTNASTSLPIDGNYFPDILVDNNNPSILPSPIVIQPSGLIRFLLKDTSGSANDVFIYLHGILSTPKRA